jgi:L-arabinose isomerase
MYLELYDQSVPECRAECEAFAATIAGGLREQGIEVVAAPVSRVRPEFEAAVAQFAGAGVDAIVTLHLAYSPSLECIDALCQTNVPLIALDTTPDVRFGRDADPARLMFNHGIHGVMDIMTMLRRRGRPCEIVAGHWQESDVLARAADRVRVARAAARFRSTRALRVGPAFDGMGDFRVARDTMRDELGIRVEQVGVDELRSAVAHVTDDAVEQEVAADRERFEVAVDDETHRRSVRSGLGLRRLLAEYQAGALSVNFLAFDRAEDTVPFLEISKAMARGVGYGGEGDVLTASLVGALLAAWPDTTFTEIFCPVWDDATLFLAHMGEVNPALAAAPPLLTKRPFPFTAAGEPALLACCLRPGPAVFVNLAPGPDDTFRVISAPVEMLEDSPRDDFRDKVRGWMRIPGTTARFLETYSQLGGTHHSALVPGDVAAALGAFARLLDIEHCEISE